MSWGRPTWSPEDGDGISWPPKVPLLRGGTTAGMEQLCFEASKWNKHPWESAPTGAVDLPPDTPLTQVYSDYLHAQIDNARDLSLLDEWSWAHAADNPPTLAWMAEMRRAIPVLAFSGAGLRGLILHSRRIHSAGTYAISSVIPSVAMATRNDLNSIRMVYRFDFADGERAAGGGMSLYNSVVFRRWRLYTEPTPMAFPDWGEPVSVRQIADASMPEDPDYDWSTHTAQDLWDLIGSSAELATISRADMVAQTFTPGNSVETVQGDVHVALPSVGGSGRLWLAFVVPSDSTKLPSWHAQELSIFSDGPRLYWSEPTS